MAPYGEDDSWSGGIGGRRSEGKRAPQGPHVPHRDERDRGDLPDELLPVSHALGVFLRYKAPERRLCLDDGWVSVSVTMAELGKDRSLTFDENGLRTVIKESYSKDMPRFESQTSPSGEEFLRAANKEKYQQRRQARTKPREQHQRRRDRADEPPYWPPGGPATWGPEGAGFPASSSAAGPQIVDPTKPPTLGLTPVPRKEVAWAMNSCDGSWATSGEATPLCCIKSPKLIWTGVGPDQPGEIKVELNGDVFVKNDLHSKDWATVRGRLDDEGDTIKFDDGNVWVRCKEVKTEVPAAATALTPAASCQGGVGTTPLLDGGRPAACSAAAERAAATSPTQAEQWNRRVVKVGWDAAGSGYDGTYLSLVQGEEIDVQDGRIEAGWAWAYSFRLKKYGWFPPSAC